MELSESSRHYLDNYFLLEQTRDDTNQFLIAILQRLAAEVARRFESKHDSVLAFEQWTLGGGGETGVLLKVREDLLPSGEMQGWKYYVNYRDAMKARDLTDPTHCVVWGSTPKANSAQTRSVSGMATPLGMADPYRVVDLPLLDAPVDDVVERLADLFDEYYDSYAGIAKALVERAGS